jgi:translation elongation factor EF-Tu-like GTPase
MSADIEVRNVFTMKGRGAVVIGYLRRGTALIGQQTRVPALGAGSNRVLTLAAVETVHAPDSSESALGLVFRERPTLEEVGSALPPGTILQFEDATIA